MMPFLKKCLILCGCFHSSSAEQIVSEETRPLLRNAERNNAIISNVHDRPSCKKNGPDGREAWVVAFAACVVNFVMAGLGRMSGYLFSAIIDIFQVDREHAYIPFAVRSSMRNLLGPVVGILGQKYSVRIVTVMGGIIGTISAAACYFVTDILWLTIVWGAINGVATALITTLPQVMIGQHFKEYRATASGIAFSGGCVASFIFPALLEIMLYTYALSGTFLIIAGIITHVIPAALLLRTPSWSEENRKRIQISTINGEICHSKSTIQQDIDNDSKGARTFVSDSSQLKVDDTFVSVPEQVRENEEFRESCGNTMGFNCNKCSCDIEFLHQNCECVMQLLKWGLVENNLSETDQNNSSIYRDILQKDIEIFLSTIQEHLCTIDTCGKSISSFEHDCVLLNNIQLININEKLTMNEAVGENTTISLWQLLENLLLKDREYILKKFPDKERENISKILKELHQIYSFVEHRRINSHIPSTLPKIGVLESSDNKIEDVYSNTFSAHIMTAFRLHTKPLFLLICFCRTMHFLTFMPVMITIVDFAKDKGFSEGDGKYAIAALSAGDILGRSCLGWVTDRGYVSLPRFMLFVMIIQGASTISLAFWDSKALFMSGIAVFGLIQGSLLVRHPVLLSRYVGNHEQSIAMGCINFLSGLLGFALPLYIGHFRDTIGSYNGIFYINGGIGAFIGLLWAFEPYLLRMSKMKNNDDQSGV